MPKAIGIAQWMVTGRHVHEKTNWPIGVMTAAMVMMAAVASGCTLPVSGSFSCELTIRRQSGSHTMASMVPTPMPRKASPEVPGPHPRCWENTMGYATKHRYLVVD